jgi:hypothetical protein
MHDDKPLLDEVEQSNPVGLDQHSSNSELGQSRRFECASTSASRPIPDISARHTK